MNVASTESGRDGRGPAAELAVRGARPCRAGCGYVNFTPSTGLHHPALAAAAAASGVPYAGRDGKTGQTLLRSVLGPMFAQRALDVRAWSGTNLLGGGDGAALADPAAAAAKNAGKERVLTDTLGRQPRGRGPYRRRTGARRLEDRLGPHRLRRVSSAPAWSCRPPGRAATRRWRRPWSWTWPD
ncbi:hypothetical protein GCM10017687_87910 [Streptomyces echinatus]